MDFEKIIINPNFLARKIKLKELIMQLITDNIYVSFAGIIILIFIGTFALMKIFPGKKK